MRKATRTLYERIAHWIPNATDNHLARLRKLDRIMQALYGHAYRSDLPRALWETVATP